MTARLLTSTAESIDTDVVALDAAAFERLIFLGCASTMMDAALNVFFFVFHTSWIAFNCLGWMWRRTRPWQLVTVSLTAFSWFGLGAWYGWGYCPCTDWHWQVRARLGHQDPSSYIQLLIRELTGFDPGPALADAVAVATLAGVTLLSVVLYARDRRAPRNSASL